VSGRYDPIETLLAALRSNRCEPKRQGASWRVKCPSHRGESDDSLKIDRGDDGRALLTCFAGCEPSAMVEAVGLTLSDLFPDSNERSQLRATIKSQRLTPQPAKNAPARKIDRSTPYEAEYPYYGPNGVLRYVVRRYDNPKDFRPFVPGVDYSTRGMAERVPYRLPELRASDGLVIIAEGEKDVHALESLGFPATCNDGGAGKWTAEHARWLAGRDIVVIPDNDEPGIKHAHAVAATLQGIARSVKVLEPLPGVTDKGDPFDWIEAGGTAAELRALIDTAPEWEPGKVEATGPRLELVSLADVQPREVDWFWQNWLARGKLHILAGHPGDGKSTLTAWLAAVLSNGAVLPDGSIAPELGTLFLLGEDAADDTLRPRLDLHGADVGKIAYVRAVIDGGRRSVLNLSKHLDQIRDALKTGRYGVLVVDPLTAFMPKTDRNAEGDVRDVLTPLADVADETGAAVLAVMHLGKGSGDKGRRLLQSILGATAFGAAARVVWMNAELPDSGDPVKRILQVKKSNIGPKPPPYEWARAIDGPVIWHGQSERDIEDVLSGSKVSALETACDFLRRELANGARTQGRLVQAAKTEGISEAALQRAKKHLGIESIKPEGTKHGPWLWQLAHGQDEQKPKAEHLDLDAVETVQGAQDVQNSPNTKNEHLEHLDRSDSQDVQNRALEHLEDVSANGRNYSAHRSQVHSSPRRKVCRACGAQKPEVLECPECRRTDSQAIAYQKESGNAA
jgi:hypothetical protein